MSKYTAHEQFADTAEAYLDRHGIYEKFMGLLQETLIEQPVDPISFLIGKLTSPINANRFLLTASPTFQLDPVIGDIVREFSVVPVSVTALLQAEIDNKSEFGTSVASYANDDNTDLVASVPAELLVPFVKNRLSKPDVAERGYVMHDFPKTKAQAVAFQRTGSVIAKLVVISDGKDSATADSKTTEYNKQITEVVDLYAAVAVLVPAAASVEATSEQVVIALNDIVIAKAPKRPLRVAILGHRGSGKETQGIMLSQKFGAVHVSVGSLLRAEQDKNSDAWAAAAPFYNAGMLVPDDVVVPLVEKRLLQKDCRTRGWILDGFPRTEAQAQALAEKALVPSRVVVLSVKATVALDRVVHRRTDPASTEVYHLTLAPPPEAIKLRLQQNPFDTETRTTQINNDIASGLSDVVTFYQNEAKTIDGNASEALVFSRVQTFILASLSKNVA